MPCSSTAVTLLRAHSGDAETMEAMAEIARVHRRDYPPGTRSVVHLLGAYHAVAYWTKAGALVVRHIVDKNPA